MTATVTTTGWGRKAVSCNTELVAKARRSAKAECDEDREQMLNPQHSVNQA